MAGVPHLVFVVEDVGVDELVQLHPQHRGQVRRIERLTNSAGRHPQEAAVHVQA